MKTQSKAFEVTYTKKVGGNGSIIVKAPDEKRAIKCARFSCFTGRDFRDAIEIDIALYTKPTAQGFSGSGRAN